MIWKKSWVSCIHIDNARSCHNSIHGNKECSTRSAKIKGLLDRIKTYEGENASLKAEKNNSTHLLETARNAYDSLASTTVKLNDRILELTSQLTKRPPEQDCPQQNLSIPRQTHSLPQLTDIEGNRKQH